MIRVFSVAILTFLAVSMAIGQCAIQPIKPIPPIGCRDVTPQCVSDGNGNSHWNWVCVPDNGSAPTGDNHGRKPNMSGAASPSAADPSTIQPTGRNSVNGASQESIAQLPIGVPIREMDAGEQRATEELRAVAESIKTCPALELPQGAVDPLLAEEGFESVYGPPLNVVWNVEARISSRARYTGFIEFSEPSYLKLPPDDSYCNKPKMNKSECRRRWVMGTQIYQRQLDHPLQFRYEFDVTPQGLEFLRAFKKTRQTDNEPWVAGAMNSDACAVKAIKLVLNSPNVHDQLTSPQLSVVSQDPEQASKNATQPGSNSADQSSLDISTVALGTPRDIALSGLANNYKLTKEDFGGGPIEVWQVEKKAVSGPTDFWEIAFRDGKLASVITHLSPTLHGDAVGLAQQLFAELYPRAEAESGQVAKFLGSREITVEVELGQVTTATGNEETMRLRLPNGTAFEIKIEAPVTSAPTVSTSDFRTN
jgi:hypothetical protein